MNNLDRIKHLRAQDYGVAGLSTTDVDWLIAEVERLQIVADFERESAKDANAQLNARVAELERERDHAVRAAELQAEVPDGWQPISTAPRNGDRILVWREHSTFARAARFDPAHEEFFDDDRVHLHNLTHWMPMPKAPMDMLAAQSAQEGTK